MGSSTIPRLAQSIEKQLAHMQESYESLANMLSVATVTPETVDKTLASLNTLEFPRRGHSETCFNSAT